MARPRKFEEHDVVVAARRQFTETGYHGTSVEDISRATGLSKGSLYGAFGDKEALFQRVLDDYCTAAEESAATLLDGPEDQALERLRSWLLAPLDHVDRRGCLLARATAELAWEDDAVATRSLAAYETLLDTCRRLVEQAQRAGLVDPAADAEALGGVVLATHRGLEALGKAGMDPETMKRIAGAAVDGIALTAAPVRGRRRRTASA
ncbi:TetR family transcriptional regulator [Kineococcus sp. T13]|uniref:TetR/AcrR family transcriptional regulator n=1 Tax=Kineococcus vitellinus TaxID=2696565 RepID=UPI001412B6D4|nr:TetR/AcrR family transcriptional regulator [Kineococcus vitellinus]NAZ74302.1 TetR family transcriptional regulator [Kineococcus vitellinus]